MSAVWKSHAAGAVATLDTLMLPGRGNRQPVPDPRIEALEAEITQLRAELSAAHSAAEAATKQAFASGKAAAAREETARTALVADGLAEACGDWRDRLARTERLAIDLALLGLAKVLGSDHGSADLVRATIAAAADTLRRDTILCLAVSAADFPDRAAVADIAGTLGATVQCDPALAAGACRATLASGTRDLSLSEQWSALQNVLRELGDAA